MMHLGDFPASHTAVCIPFDSFAAATGAPSATTNFAAGDVQIYKDGSTTQRSSSAGITVSTSFDTNTGLQFILIDLSDNTDAGFYAAGHEYTVAVADITIDAQTVRFWAGSFSIERAGGILALLKGAGLISVNATKIGGTSQTGRDIGASVLLAAGQKVDVDTIKTNPVVNNGTVTFPTNATLASTTNITAGTITTTTSLTNLPAITANWLTAAGIAAGALNGKGDWLLSSGYTSPSNLTAAQIATGVWQDTTAGDFTTALSVGKSIMNGVSLGTGLTVAAVSGAVGSVAGAVGSVTGAVGSVTGITASDVGAIKAKTDNLPASPAAVSDIPSAATIAAAVWAVVIDGTNSAIKLMRGFAAAMMGKASGLATTSVVYRDIGDSKNVISATVDADGNRSAVTLDLT